MHAGSTSVPRWLALLALGAAHASCRRPAANHQGSDTGVAPGAVASAFPVSVVDALGRTVVVPREPRRIIALLPSHTETLFALGAGDSVVAVDDYSDDPPSAQRLPRLGGLYDTHLETALALAPDLALVSDSSAALGPLTRAGIVTWAGSAGGFDDVFGVIGTVGRMVGRVAEADALVTRMQRDISEIEESARKLPPVSVYYELDATPYAIGPSSFVGVMLAKVGGLNIVPPELGPFPKINPELVVAASPSVIIGPTLEQVAARAGWSGIEAVRTGRVYALSDRESHVVVRPGPRLPQAMRLLARILHPGT